jgi:hypothetical protein
VPISRTPMGKRHLAMDVFIEQSIGGKEKSSKQKNCILKFNTTQSRPERQIGGVVSPEFRFELPVTIHS